MATGRYERGRRQIWSLLFLGAAIWLCCLPARAGDLYAEGLDLYRRGRYLEAVISLSRVVEQEPQRAEAHYYLANALAHLRQYRDAISEYEYCRDLSPHSQFGSYSVLAIERFAGAAEREARAPAARTLEIPAIQMPPGYDELNQKRRSLIAIKTQTEREKMRARSEGTATIEALMSTTELSVRRVRDEAQKTIDEMGASARRGHLRHNNPAVVAVERERDEAIRNLRMQAQATARRHMRDYVARARAMEECASNLETQVINSPSKGMRLQAAGTNVYVRNYEYVQPEALVAVARRLEPSRWAVRR